MSSGASGNEASFGGLSVNEPDLHVKVSYDVGHEFERMIGLSDEKDLSDRRRGCDRSDGAGSALSIFSSTTSSSPRSWWSTLYQRKPFPKSERIGLLSLWRSW
jgi:hypothetical protein